MVLRSCRTIRGRGTSFYSYSPDIEQKLFVAFTYMACRMSFVSKSFKCGISVKPEWTIRLKRKVVYKAN